MLDAFFDLIATTLAWFYDLWPSYGMAIIFLTLAVMLVLTPLTLKGTRSMLQLQHLQPEIKKIQQQYKDDRQKLNEEVMKFYAEHKINPLGGCLPMLVQLPVFIILYNVIQGLTRRTSLLQAVVEGDPSAAGTFDPKYLEQDTALYGALHESDEMVSWGFDLSRSAVAAMGDGIGSAWPYVLLVLGIVATSVIQQRQIQGRNPNAQINPQMQAITKILPFMFAIFSLNFAAALCVYWFMSGLYRIGQQGLITHSIYKPHHAKVAASGGPVTTTATETDASPVQPERSGFLGRLLSPPPAAGNGDGAGTKAAKSGAKPKPAPARAGKGPGGGSSTAPAGGPRASGRVTPPGSRPASSRKRKKRK